MASTFAMQACRNITELHTLCSTQEKQIEKLKEEVKEVESINDDLTEKFLPDSQLRQKEIEDLTNSRDTWKKSFEMKNGEVKHLLEFKEGVADALELSNPDLVEPDDVSNKICEITDELEEDRKSVV